jgi:hydrogenase large subunit
MSRRIVVDPITRIEGHLRIEVEIQDGKIVDAYSSGTMVRGFELILKGRDPRDAWALPNAHAECVQPFTPLHR